MTTKPKTPKHAVESAVAPKKAEEDKAPARLRLDYLTWAWQFLRRNEEYKVLYHLRFDSSITNEDRIKILFSNPMTRALPIELFEVDPEPIYGDTLGSWLDRNESKKLPIDIDIRDIFDPRRYCLTSWIDPACNLPTPMIKAFDLSVFELDEVWAIDFKSQDQLDEFQQQGYSPRDFECSLGLTATKPTQIALKFDLRLPLDSQLAQAERQLKNAANIYKEKTVREWHRIPEWTFRVNRDGAWSEMLKLLDLLPASSSNVDLFRRFKKAPDLKAYDSDAKKLEPLLKDAKFWSEIGYRSLILKGLGNSPAMDWRLKKGKYVDKFRHAVIKPLKVQT